MKRLIKAEELRAGGVDSRPMLLPDVGAEARHILAEAAAEAGRLVEEARRQAASIHREAASRGYEEGSQRGLAAGLAEGRRSGQRRAGEEFSADLAELTALTRRIAEELDRARAEALQQARGQMLDFAIEIATKIVHRVAEGDIEAARANVEKVLELAGSHGNVTIRVNPAQLEMLERHASELVEALRFRGKVKLVGDERIGKGGVRLLGRQGEIDATIQTQIANVTEALRGPTPSGGGEKLPPAAAKEG